MTSDRITPSTDEPPAEEPEEHGMLPETGDVATSTIGILGGPTTAQVTVVLGVTDEDDVVDDVVDDEEIELLDAASVIVEPVAAVDAARTDTTVVHDEIAAVHDDGAADEDAEEADVDEPTPTPAAATAPAPASSGTWTTRREAHETGAVPRITRPPQDAVLVSKRVGDLGPDRESSDLLTADRLLDRARVTPTEPEGLWQQFVYGISGRRINLGDSRRVRSRKALDRRIAASLDGEARFVPVLSRKGGVGKTTVTALLGMALADAREDRVIALDANPDRGTLAERIVESPGHTVRDLVRVRGEVAGFNDISRIVARDETRLDVLASDADPHVSEAFSDGEYRDVAALAEHYYSIVLTDTGTGIVHSVMGATLGRADAVVVVAGLRVDEARLAAETLTWLEQNGFAELARNAVVVLNGSRPGTPLVRESELEAHFASRVRTVIRVPYDPAIATGSTISYRELRPETRAAARELAAAVVEGLGAVPSAA